MRLIKLLLFSDLHCDVDAAQALVDRAGEADIFIGAGDFATCRRGIEKTIRVLQNVERPTVLVPGNAESVEELVEACQDWPSSHVLHGTAATIGDLEFFGLGGGVPVTPFGAWSYDFTEQQAADLLDACPSHAVLVSHSPPQGMADADSSGHSLGSAALRRAIEEKSPRLVVCGHIHASWGKQGRIGTTPVVNAGPRGMEWTLAVAPPSA